MKNDGSDKGSMLTSSLPCRGQKIVDEKSSGSSSPTTGSNVLSARPPNRSRSFLPRAASGRAPARRGVFTPLVAGAQAVRAAWKSLH
jgi:hypothetical protein